jgi:hypothetical protein
MHTRAKYSDEFLGKALPYLQQHKETAADFAAGPQASAEAKIFQWSERLGARIDRTLHSRLPKK